MRAIPFNQPYLTGKEISYILEASTHKLSGDGPFTKRCQQWLESQTECLKALLTHSCTAALEMSALLLNLQPGDEVIMPSYTFVSTANAFVLRGCIPVFVDIREDTLNLNEQLIEAAITAKTRAIVAVHYAGVACDMNAILKIANNYGLAVIEDAAQAIMSSYCEKPLGSIGHLGAYSFHETKNIISGEGGALLINDQSLVSRAEIIWEKGTNRKQFLKGEVDKYTWQEPGSSFLPGELTAAFLYAQLEEAERIIQKRISHWNYYHHLLEPLEMQEKLRRPIIPKEVQHNAHMYYVLLNPKVNRQHILTELGNDGIQATSHYVPLHSSPAGQRFGRSQKSLPITDHYSKQLLRLPLWVALSQDQQDKVVSLLEKFI